MVVMPLEGGSLVHFSIDHVGIMFANDMNPTRLLCWAKRAEGGVTQCRGGVGLCARWT